MSRDIRFEEYFNADNFDEYKETEAECSIHHLPESPETDLHI